MSKHNQQQDYTATLESTTPETLTLKDRFAIAKIISKAPKSRVLMISKVFEPVLGTDLTPYYDERSLQDSVSVRDIISKKMDLSLGKPSQRNLSRKTRNNHSR